jgi:hypothetical protein
LRAIKEAAMAKREEPLVDTKKSVEKNLTDIPQKSGTAGTLLLALIITGLLGIVVLAILLLTR